MNNSQTLERTVHHNPVQAADIYVFCVPVFYHFFLPLNFPFICLGIALFE